MKVAFKFLLIIAVAAALVLSLVGGWGKSAEQVCTGVQLEVEDSLKLGMINSGEVEAVLKQKHLVFENRKTSEINLADLESTLSKVPYIDTAYASFNASGKLVLRVIPRMPALHVMAANGEEYYLDRRGVDIPVGNLTGNLVVATGKISKRFAREKLAPLACCLQDSAYWRQQVQQIDVVGEHDVRMYTRIMDHEVLLGDLDNIPDKLQRLRIFYQQGLPKTGWNRYEAVSVEFQGIVIGRKKEK